MTPRVIADAAAMRSLGREVAAALRAGDLVLLSGSLGAGKTTFAQGVGDGLGVRGPVTSPTFVIARVHPSLVEGPPMVHVDAYRLGGWDELEDLDLEATLHDAVTLVEWGTGVAEGLSGDRLEVRIERAVGSPSSADPSGAGSDGDEDARRVIFTGVGPRWATTSKGDIKGDT